MTDYATWIPEYDGHAPPFWVHGMKWDVEPYYDWVTKKAIKISPSWFEGMKYRVSSEAVTKRNKK